LSSNGSHPSRVGRYAIVEVIGHGANGPVYAALDEDIGRRVAVRVGKPGDPRVHQQARTTGQVAHPNVVSVLDLGEDGGAPFAVTELVAGAAVTHEPLQSLDRCLDLMLQVCDGLHAAHDRRVVHGGLKPGHVLVQSGSVKLIDFGIGRRQDVFASPEQACGELPSPASDVFSAAATFHFLATGKAPFASSAAVVTEPPLSIPAAAAPETFARTLFKAMDKEPGRRHAGINHLRAELEQVRQGRSGNRSRVLVAALDRYRDIEALLAQRRALGRRLNLPAVEGECDAKLATLAARFPDFARAGLDVDRAGDIDQARASEALAELQLLHNEVAAEVAVLRSASGVRR
jgi:serine/threonine protein kinase